MHVKPQMVRDTASKPTTMLLSLRGQGFLNGDLQNAPLVQALGDHAHARMMDIRIRGTRLRGFETGLLGVQHRLIQLALQRCELAVDRESARDVSRVQAIDLDTSIDEQQFAVADHTGVAHPMQDRRMLARGDNRVIADGVALLACHRIERALQHALGTRASNHARQVGEHTVETVLRGLDSLADLANFILVLDHALLRTELRQRFIGLRVRIRVAETVRLAHPFDHLRNRRIGGAHHAQLHGTRLGADILADRILKRGDVMGLDARHRLELTQAGTRADPVLAVMGVAVVISRAVIGTRGDKQFRRMGFAGLRLRAVRIERVEHEHGTRLIIAAQAGIVRERGIRAEGVIAIIVAHFRLTRGNDNALAREPLAQLLETLADVLARFQRLDRRLGVVPAGGHELAERLAVRAQRTVVHPVSHRLVRPRRVLTFFGLVCLVCFGDHRIHDSSRLVPFPARTVVGDGTLTHVARWPGQSRVSAHRCTREFPVFQSLPL